MLEPTNLETTFGFDRSSSVSIQLLLFIDKRPSSREYIQNIQHYFKQLKSDFSYQLQVIEIAEHPHLVEHFRLVAAPALVKVSPAPRQILAGSNIVNQLRKWCPRWQLALKESGPETSNNGKIQKQDSPKLINSLSHSAELMRLSDRVFHLNQEKEELIQQLKFKEQVLAMLAHDLRSPLTAASITVETLELAQNHQHPQFSVELKEELYQQARKQFRIMNRLITDILQVSQTMKTELDVHYNDVLLQVLCEEILKQYTNLFKEKSLILVRDIPQDIPQVYADEELIRQVIVNLLDNAIKYTPSGGKVTVSILHRTSQKVQVSVCDTGPGIPEEERERIFEGYFRLKRDQEKEGYGLGLSLCRKIIRAHYGQIWVNSILNQGSCFKFTLPVCR
ncbi:histidine kinase [Cyanobacterium sp. uoEpiScrs1]|uniref:histidine kinase n=1 Tax=Cyanobacterium sp. uoEpiScrs1 TaxID=2976343 RepID=UPI00226AA43F|nr:histidine kinase [Cyanobacterium sp. uoEpiScrs1]